MKTHAISYPHYILKAFIRSLGYSLAMSAVWLADSLPACAADLSSTQDVQPVQEQGPQALNRIDVTGQSSGGLMVNTTAGDSNQQQNLLVIAHAPQGLALATVNTRQSWLLDSTVGATALGSLRSGNYSARIEGTSFRGAQGVTAVNQSAGVGNQQVNAVAIAIGRSAVTAVTIAQANDALLGQVAAAPDGQSGGQPATGRRTLSIDGSAFSGASGIVQVNQIAGVGNRTSNVVTFAIAN